MARDVVVNWKGERPTRDEIQTMLEDYLGAAGKIEWQKDRFVATLPGAPSYARARVGLATPWQRTAWQEKMREPEPKRWSYSDRFFEVWSDAGCTYVMTRDADELTMAVADTFAEVLCRGWQGEMEAA